MLRNLASSLFLTERDAELDQNAPKVAGRVVTTLHKAKEVRPLVERCITIARHSLRHAEAAEEHATDAERNSDAWRKWRASDEWQKWCAARAPVVAAQRRALRLLGDREAVQILFDEIAPRFEDRDGGYTRVLKLASPRLGDAGPRAILEFVGVHDRVSTRSEKPEFAAEDAPEETPEEEAGDAAEQSAAATDETAAEASSPEAAAADESASEESQADEEKKDEAS
jgi:large subunit ribosomal protein L17